MLANRADLDVYVWAQVGKGLAKLKTAQNIAIISHLEKYVHTVIVQKMCSKMRLFSESARLPKKCTKHPKSTHLSVPLGGAGIYIYICLNFYIHLATKWGMVANSIAHQYGQIFTILERIISILKGEEPYCDGFEAVRHLATTWPLWGCNPMVIAPLPLGNFK